ncbi:MAG TPA: cytochrome d ubiquinol oxidase subunit II [Stellaceae bacterium]|jgi:cytochrome d ubiquinol oxidase subunit II|nr:cytochrome d ubiquinol oxidase subunit II [Stellaceae bacterium]
MITYFVLILAIGLFLYVLLDGFDLGVGMLFGLTRNENLRQQMLGAISPVWDGNETWLVLAGTILYAAFSAIYSILLSAFYIPLMMMLGALILRGVAFEFRYKTERGRWIWDTGFVGGSVLATFMQGATVGALVNGLPVANLQFQGTSMDWLTPFSALCGIGLCLGYALLGAAWLILKTEHEIRDRAYILLPWLMMAVLMFLGAAFVYATAIHLQVMRQWFDRPALIVFPALGAIGCAGLLYGMQARKDGLPFLSAAVIFLAAFGTMAASFWPYMLPYSITIEQAASPPSTLNFMFWGIGLIVFPLILIYNAGVYIVFHGKVDKHTQYH